MLKALIDFLLNRKGHPVQHDTTAMSDAPVAPYKVEPPSAAEPAKCGCGRSQSGFCVGLHKLSQAEWDAHPENKAKVEVRSGGDWPFPQAVEQKPAVKAKSVRAKKAPVAAMTAAAKPARKPRAKKAKE